MRKFIWLFIFSCLLILVPHEGAANDLPILRVGYMDQPGYLSLDEPGDYSGYAFEYMETLATYGNWRIAYVPGTRQECRRRLANGEIDVICGMRKSTVLEDQFDYTSYAFALDAMELLQHDGQDVEAGGKYRIGYQPGNPEEAKYFLAQFAKRQNVQYTLVPYQVQEDVEQAYDLGQIDGFFQERSIKSRDGEVVSVLCTLPTYLAVRKGNTALLVQLNEAIEYLQRVDPQWNTALFEKYFYRQIQQPPLLTPHEREYLKEKKKIVVFASPKQPPYTYFENGQYKGIVEEILQKMEQDLDVEFEVLERPEDDEEITAMMERGEADAIVDFFSDFNWANEYNAQLTFPYLNLDYVAVVRRNEGLPEKPRVACPRGYYYTHHFVEQMFPPEQLVYCDSQRKSLAAVSSGQADMAFAKAVTVQRDIWDGKFYDLVTNGNVFFTHGVSMAVNRATDPILLHILNKEIKQLNPEETQRIVNKELFSTKEEGNLWSYVYRYPLRFLGGVIAAALLIIASLLYAMMLRQRYTKRLREMAYTDSVLKIHNMNWFVDMVPGMIAKEKQARIEGRMFIAVFELERGAVLNNNYGRKSFLNAWRRHISLAQSESPWIRAVAVLAEQPCVFCCMAPGEDILQAVTDLVDRHHLFRLGTMRIRATFKVGICPVPPEGALQLHPLIDAARVTCNELLGQRVNVGFYNEEQQQEKTRQIKIESLMEKALQAQEFQVWYQPKYDIRTHRVKGAEALVRWQSPELGFMMPGQFIDQFEQCGFIVEFDYYMLEAVCRYQRRRLDAGLPIVTISVNQSRLHMQEVGYLEHMQQIVNRYQLPAHIVELELTETAFGDFDKQHALAVVKGLQAMGYVISMDDFGTGYSSLALLQLIPVDVMKLDRSLLLAAEVDMRSQIILDGAIQMGNALDMHIICEGIETEAQEQLLLKHGCCFGQGFLFARPMSAGDFEQFLDRQLTL